MIFCSCCCFVEGLKYTFFISIIFVLLNLNVLSKTKKKVHTVSVFMVQYVCSKTIITKAYIWYKLYYFYKRINVSKQYYNYRQ